MKKRHRFTAFLLSIVLIFGTTAAACAAGPPIPGGSVPIKASAGTRLQEILKRLDLPDAWVSADASSAEPLEHTAAAATGMVVHAPGMEPQIVVRGDVLGTGIIGLSQLARLAQAFSGVRPLEGVFMDAGDINETGTIELADLTMLASYVMTGTMPAPQKPVPADTDIMAVAAVQRRPLQDPQSSSEPAEQAASGANDFAFRLSTALLAEQDDEDGNFVCSPYSVWLPLAALLNATEESKQPELLEALGAAGLTAEDINSAASRMLYGLTAVQQNEWNQEMDMPLVDPLKIANAIFVDRTQTVAPKFAEVFANDYLGDSISVDFSSKEAVDAVNQWCSDNTDGLITDIVNSFDPQTVAAIANAIYFSDRWYSEFNPDMTRNSTFHAPTGDMDSPFMLREGYKLDYYEDDTVQAMPLNFATGGGLAILLPKDGDAESLLSSLTDERFSQILAGTSGRTGKLLLPRFEIESGVMNLRESLAALGVPLFDPAEPAVTKLLADADPLVISQAVQSAKIKVDEKGTTAAAVTVIALAGAALPQPTQPFEMNCDHPFVFVLYGDTYDGGAQVLFTGVVNQPEAA